MPTKELEYINLGNHERANPFTLNTNNKYFVYYYGYSFSGLSSSLSDFTLLKLGKSQQTSPNLAVLERVGLKLKDKNFVEFPSDRTKYIGDYYIFAENKCEGIVNTFNEALEFVNSKSDIYERILIGKKCIVHNEFPSDSNLCPFDPQADGSRFIYLTARQNRYSYLADEKCDMSFEKLSRYFPMGYTNLWIMERLGLLSMGKIEIFIKNEKAEMFYVMDSNEIIEEFLRFDEALTFCHQNSETYEKLLIARRIQNIYWH